MDRQFPVFVCVLQDFPAMGPEEVDSICAQVLDKSPVEFAVCISDLPGGRFGDHLSVITLNHRYQGWWCLVEAFRMPGPVLFMGIDSVVTGNLWPLVDYICRLPPHEVVMYRPPKREIADQGFWASGVMGWNTDLRFIYDEFHRNPKGWMSDRRFRKAPNGLRMEQDFTTLQLQKKDFKITAAQDVCTGIYSYKRHVRVGRRGTGDGKLPEDARLVLFHGKPRPQDAPEGYWREYREVAVGV